MIRVELQGGPEFAASLHSARWDSELRAAHVDVGDQVRERAASKASGLGGASAKTAGTLQSSGTLDFAEITASAPYARGSEFGSGGGPTTQQFARIPGANREDGYWLGPALDEQQDELLRPFDKMLDEVTRPAFDGF